MRSRHCFLIAISASSGTGKTTLCNILQKRRKDIKKIVSWTTRHPRENERHGIDYFFVKKKEFHQKIKNNYFLEWAPVHGSLYGTPLDRVKEVLKSGKNVLLNIDVKGALAVQKTSLPTLLIFVLPPSLDVLKKRLAIRNSEQGSDREKRLAHGSKEISAMGYYDYVVINDNINETVDLLEKIISAEKKERADSCHPSKRHHA